ncbi:MAG: RagB/SusD family nutrient uptake outer membrane protein [Muribaculaceae bacterium]|nr:RagB/SusD family nutrient uptake outer membrane protein [Muribaculaceae bacterium]
MKTNIKRYLKAGALSVLALTAGLGTVSCDSLLDTKPTGVFGSDQIGEDEAVSLMVAAYATLMNHYFGNNESFAGPINNWIIDVRSDDALKGGDNVTMEGNLHQLEVGNVQSDNVSILFKWRNDFYSITRCNVALKGIEASTKLDAKTKASMIGEMKTLRAYYYFDLYRLFKKFPYFDEKTEDPSTVSASKYTKAEILGFIRSDLRESYKNMVDHQSQAGRFNKYVAAALLAKVDMFAHEYAEAEEYAGYVISSGLYDLYPNFGDISKPEMNNTYESIMACQFSTANNPDQFNFNNCINCTYNFLDKDHTITAYGNGDDFYLGSQDLANAFRTDENGLPYLDGGNGVPDVVNAADYAGNVDPRIDFTLGRIGMPWRGYEYTEDWCRNLPLYGQYSGKKPYPSPDSPYVTTGIVPWGASSLNYIIIRYADVLLMKAEALIEQGKDLEQARNLINQVRRKAARSINPDYTPVDLNPMNANYLVKEYPASGWSVDYARKAVRHERRIELAMEGHRWFDLLRWGNALETMQKYYQFEQKYQPYYSSARLSEDDLYFPVPQEQKDNAGGLYD